MPPLLPALSTPPGMEGVLFKIENGAGGYFAGAGTHWHKQALWL